MKIKYDLHIHSCLSPCGDDASTPVSIAGFAALAGLDIVALSDHNSARNCAVFERACEFYGIASLCGMEITSAEEIHVLCLFESAEAAMECSLALDSRRMKFPLKEKIFGQQLVVDEDDNVTAREESLLLTASDIGFNDMQSFVAPFGGIAIPAHIDKNSDGVISALGCVPPEADVTALELFHHGPIWLGKSSLAEYVSRPLESYRTIINSDAHTLDLIGVNANQHPIELDGEYDRSMLPKAVLDYLKKYMIK